MYDSILSFIQSAYARPVHKAGCSYGLFVEFGIWGGEGHRGC